MAINQRQREHVMAALARLAARDPGRRGVVGACVAEATGSPLSTAARSLADDANHVAIVTGFMATSASDPAAETDGPPGALYLAQALLELDCTVTLITDRVALSVLAAGCQHRGLDPGIVTEFPFEEGPVDSFARRCNAPEHNMLTDAWVEEFLRSPAARRLTHLIAVERPGPSHTVESLMAQPRAGPPPRARFQRESPADSRNTCHNMRGQSINAYTAKTHRLFEMAAGRRRITSIGLADGGNEIGMGRFPWESLADAIPGGLGGQIACRTTTDHTIVAGVSNWAAYALTLAVGYLRDRLDILKPLDVANERRLIEHLVCEGGAVDGVTGRRKSTVDGLTRDEYFGCLAEMRRAVGLDA